MLGWILAVLDFEECDREEEGKGKSRWRKGCNGSKDDDEEEEGVDWGFAMGWEEVEEGKLVEEVEVGSPPFDEVDCWLCLPLEGWGWLLFPFPLPAVLVASPAPPPPPCELLESVLVPFAAALLAAFSAFANSLAFFGLVGVEGVEGEEVEDWSLFEVEGFDSLVGLPWASRDGGLGEDILLESSCRRQGDVVGIESTPSQSLSLFPLISSPSLTQHGRGGSSYSYAPLSDPPLSIPQHFEP